jgi:hypothetical protein
MLMKMVVEREEQALKIIGRTIGMKAMDALSRRLKTSPFLDLRERMVQAVVDLYLVQSATAARE